MSVGSYPIVKVCPRHRDTFPSARRGEQGGNCTFGQEGDRRSATRQTRQLQHRFFRSVPCEGLGIWCRSSSAQRTFDRQALIGQLPHAGGSLGIVPRKPRQRPGGPLAEPLALKVRQAWGRVRVPSPLNTQKDELFLSCDEPNAPCASFERVISARFSQRGYRQMLS